VIPVSNCLVAAKEIGFSELAARTWKGDMRVEIAASNSDERSIALMPTRGESKFRLSEGPAILHEKVLDKTLEVSNNSFWQGHVNAPSVLSEVVRDFAGVKNADHVLDLYGGVGLFAAALIELVGTEGRIELIEGSKSATSDASRNFAENTNVKVITGDPPRDGAGKIVVSEISRLKPRTIVYVACDPAALARDTGYFLERGYSLVKLRAFDLFPMTHHIECVARFEPAKVS
jgi:tRNA/tmRNA/rRNA uracil-C5-methylase (TrmA/RlmC/RlmD family)